MATAGCTTLTWACCPVQCHLLQKIMLYVPQKASVKYMLQRAIICNLQISDKSWDMPLFHQGGLNSSSGESMIPEYKITPCHVVSMLRLNWSGTNPPLVAMMLLHLRRLWQPPEEATVEDTIPYQNFYLVFLEAAGAKRQQMRLRSSIDKELDAPALYPHLLAQWEPKK